MMGILRSPPSSTSGSTGINNTTSKTSASTNSSSSNQENQENNNNCRNSIQQKFDGDYLQDSEMHINKRQHSQENQESASSGVMDHQQVVPNPRLQGQFSPSTSTPLAATAPPPPPSLPTDWPLPTSSPPPSTLQPLLSSSSSLTTALPLSSSASSTAALPPCGATAVATSGGGTTSGVLVDMDEGHCSSGDERTATPLCAGCQLRIVDKFYLAALDRKWHAACLKCVECGVPLENRNSCFEKNGHIFCREDYMRIFSARARQCSRCFTEIHASDLVMKARHCLYHVDCFRCSACDIILSKGDLFGMLDDVLYCRMHFDDSQHHHPHHPAMGGIPPPPPLHHPAHMGPPHLIPPPIGSGDMFRGGAPPGPPPPGGVPPPPTSTPSSSSSPYPPYFPGGPQGPSTPMISPGMGSGGSGSGVPPGGPPPPGDWYMQDPGTPGSGGVPADFPPYGGHHNPTGNNNNLDDSIAMLKKRRGRKKRKVEGGFAPVGGFMGGPGGPGGPHPGMEFGDMNASKTKRARTSFKHHQLRIMKAHFQCNQNPDSRELKMLSQKTGLDKKVLQVWFQNARAKWRRTKNQDGGVPGAGGAGTGQFGVDLDGGLSSSSGFMSPSHPGIAGDQSHLQSLDYGQMGGGPGTGPPPGMGGPGPEEGSPTSDGSNPMISCY